MTRLTRRKLIVFTAAAAVLFFVLDHFFPAAFLVQIFNGMFLGLVGAVAVVFFPLFWRAITRREFDRVSQLSIGIILTWVSLIISRSLNVIGQTQGDLNRLPPSAIALAAYLAIIGAVLHITAPGMVEQRWVYNKGILIAAVFAGLLIGATAILFQVGILSF